MVSNTWYLGCLKGQLGDAGRGQLGQGRGSKNRGEGQDSMKVLGGHLEA